MINQIQHAYQLLAQGEIVAFPTETVYGLGADATCPAAIEKVFAAKERPRNHPLIVHIAGIELLSYWAHNVSEDALALAKAFWPGPLTLVLPKREHVLTCITGGQDTVALRVPNNAITLQLLQHFKGLVGPSANAHCHISPTSALHVSKSLKDKVTFVLDGGSTSVGIESTIVSCVNGQINILRQGSISAEEIVLCCGKDVNVISQPATATPGNMAKHYAPNLPTYRIQPHQVASLQANHPNQRVVIISAENIANAPKNFSVLTLGTTPQDYAKNFYAALHQAEELTPEMIIIVNPGTESGWEAIWDKIKRCSTDMGQLTR